jgi:hypothetical protein
MAGPAPLDQPAFPDDFLESCRSLVRRRTVSLARYQRARLALLLDQSPALPNVAAGAVVELHPNSVRLWRRRWARGDFSLARFPESFATRRITTNCDRMVRNAESYLKPDCKPMSLPGSGFFAFLRTARI